MTDSRLLRRSITVAAILAAACAPMAGFADKALLIGINSYPNIKNGNLNGCVNDAKSMIDVLKRYGFQCKMISDTQATKEGILAAIAEMKSSVTANERFVFYYAGHGTDYGGGALMPHDVLPNADTKDLKRDELYNAIKSIPAISKTILLDSCYSGAMARSARAIGGMRARYIKRDAPEGGAREVIVPANRGDVVGGDVGINICYYAAARNNEVANEGRCPNGEHHGFFTYGLMQKLKGGNDLWGDVHRVVAGMVGDQTRDLQHPTISPNFTDKGVFARTGTQVAVNPMPEKPKPADPPVVKPMPEKPKPVDPPVVKPMPEKPKPVDPPVVKPMPEKPKPVDPPVVKPMPEKPKPVDPPVVKPQPEKPKPISLYEAIMMDNAEPGKITLDIAPNKTTFKLRDEITFTIKAHQKGYLMILERGISGKVNLLFPENGKVDSGLVAAGTQISIPEGTQVYVNDKIGTERVKAILFTSREHFEAVLNAFVKPLAGLGDPTRSLTLAQMKPRMLADIRAPFFTSDIIFEVVD